MSAEVRRFNDEPSLDESVKLPIARHGYDGAIDRLHAALSRTKQERAAAARRGDYPGGNDQ